MKILMLVNWKVHRLAGESQYIQAPDKFVKDGKYWFFRWWPDEDARVDVLDIVSGPFISRLEKKAARAYVNQSLHALFPSLHYDLVISHGAQSALVLALLRTFLGLRMPPHVVIDAGCFNGARFNIIESLPIKIAAVSLAGIIYHSTIQDEYYRRQFPSLVKNTEFIPFGVDADFFSPVDAVPENYILSFGEMKRDYVTLLKAWKAIDSQECRLMIVGPRNPRKMGIADFPASVAFLPRVGIDVLKKMISRSRFVVLPLPYFKYSYGQMSLLQSMSMGKGVVVTDTPAIKDYVSDGKDCLLTACEDAGMLADKIRCLINRPDTAAALGRNARKTIENEFNERKMAAKIHRYLENIL